MHSEKRFAVLRSEPNTQTQSHSPCKTATAAARLWRLMPKLTRKISAQPQSNTKPQIKAPKPNPKGLTMPSQIALIKSKDSRFCEIVIVCLSVCFGLSAF